MTVTYIYIPDNKKKSDEQPGAQNAMARPPCLGNNYSYMHQTNLHTGLPTIQYRAVNDFYSELYRYMLSFAAKDETGDGSFFAHDDIARQIVQRNCNAILNPLKLTSGPPQPLKAVRSKKFVLAVALTEESITSRAKRQYLINSILDRSDRCNSPLNIANPQTATQIAPSPTTSLAVTGASPDIARDP